MPIGQRGDPACPRVPAAEACDPSPRGSLAHPRRDAHRSLALCAVRLVKTRPLATRLCEGGHVRVNGAPAKPSTKVRAGDRVEALIADRDRVVEVVHPIQTRVGALVAATCYQDHSPPPIVTEVRPGIMAVRGEGRPSKRLRRARALAPGSQHLRPAVGSGR